MMKLSFLQFLPLLTALVSAQMAPQAQVLNNTKMQTQAHRKVRVIPKGDQAWPQRNLHPSRRLNPQQIREFWDKERMDRAQPMDLRVVNDPYGHTHQRFLQDRLGEESHDNETETDEAITYRWNQTGAMQQASGRIFMLFDENEFSCSGTVMTDNGSPDRTLIATAAHCIYNEMRRYWATNFLFIPNQDDGGDDLSNRECSDDPFGCWVPTFGVVDTEWARSLNNIPHDFGVLVVPNTGAHWGENETRVEDSNEEQILGMDLSMEDVVETVDVDLTDKQRLKPGMVVTAMGLPGFHTNELRYSSAPAKLWQNLIFVNDGGLTQGASGGSIVLDAANDPILIGLNVFKAGYWKNGPRSLDGDFEHVFVQTACGGPAISTGSFCSLVHLAEAMPLDDPTILNAGGVVHEYDGSQCLIPGPCSTDADCDDGLFCNGVETCGPDNTCVADPNGTPCDDDHQCDDSRTTDQCVPPCTMDSQCNDGEYCNGVETCENGQCVPGENPCDFGYYCNPFLNTCEVVECTSDYECDDGRYCTGEEQCIEGQCVAGYNPCDLRGGETCVEEIEACPLAHCAGVPDFCLDDYSNVCCRCIKHCQVEGLADTVVMECAPELFYPLIPGLVNPPLCWALTDEAPKGVGFDF